MDVAHYPRVTLILRDVPRRVVDIVIGTIDDGGLDLAVEITRHSATFADIDRYVREHPRVLIGAGTVITTEDARLAIDAGCRFVLSPVLLARSVVEQCHAAGLLVVPGAYTPTEIRRAVDDGADIVKIFPVRDLSASYVRDVLAPLGEVPLMGVGGVTMPGIPALFAQGMRYVGIGSGLLGPDLESVSDARIRDTLAEAARIGAGTG